MHTKYRKIKQQNKQLQNTNSLRSMNTGKFTV